MKSNLKSYLWLVNLLPALFFGCIKSSDEAFQAPPDLSTTQTEYADQFAVNLSTYRFDSLNTTSRLRLFVGGYDDPLLGPIEAKSFFQFVPANYDKIYPAEFQQIDSAFIFFRYDNLYGRPGNDEFTLHKLTQPLNGDKSYFNFSPDPPFQSDSSFSTINQTKTGRFIKIRANSLAAEIVDKWKTQGKFANDQQFLSQFPGFALVSKGWAKQITTFNLQDSVGYPPTFLRIYYGYKEEGENLTGQFDLKVDQSTVHFSTIRASNAGTPYANIPFKGAISATQTNSKSAVQGVSALVTRMEIPDILTWKNAQTKKIKIFKAELEIKPDASALYDPPTYIRIGFNSDYFVINESVNNIVFNDETIFQLLQSNYTMAGAKNQTASQVFAYQSTKGIYKCNITSYIQSLIDGSNTSTSFNIYPHFWATTFNRMLISQGNVKLKIFYYPLP